MSKQNTDDTGSVSTDSGYPTAKKEGWKRLCTAHKIVIVIVILIFVVLLFLFVSNREKYNKDVVYVAKMVGQLEQGLEADDIDITNDIIMFDAVSNDCDTRKYVYIDCTATKCISGNPIIVSGVFVFVNGEFIGKFDKNDLYGSSDPKIGSATSWYNMWLSEEQNFSHSGDNAEGEHMEWGIANSRVIKAKDLE